MKRKTLVSACAIALSFTSLNANSALVNGSVLSIDSGSSFNFFGPDPITGIDGIILGSIQAYDYSSGASVIDSWSFLGESGMHYTSSPTNVLSSTANTATVDFSGWSWTFNSGLVTLDLGSGAWGSNADGVANIICGFDCENGDTYTLTYTATVPSHDVNGYANSQYSLSLTGTVSAVPVPTAAWLFTSGLIALTGFSHRRRTR